MAKEYIEREAALTELEDIGSYDDEPIQTRNSALKIIQNIPAADVVEVVRCKDCKYCKVECGNYCCYVDDYLKMPISHCGDFYCADGERREVDDEN